MSLVHFLQCKSFLYFLQCHLYTSCSVSHSYTSCSVHIYFFHWYCINSCHALQVLEVYTQNHWDIGEPICLCVSFFSFRNIASFTFLIDNWILLRAVLKILISFKLNMRKFILSVFEQNKIWVSPYFHITFSQTSLIEGLLKYVPVVRKIL